MEDNKEIIENDDIEGIEEEVNESYLYPIDRDKIKVTVNNWTVFTFKEYLKRKKIELQPVFQRSYVWNDEKAAGLIDSIWKGLPIPQVFLLTKEDGKSLVIDGQQRLTSIARFLFTEDELKEYLPNISFVDSKRVSGLKLKVPKNIFYPGVGEEEMIYFEDLEESFRDKFESESLIVAQISPTYSLFQGDRKAISDISKEIFNRLNTGGVKLTPQEIRQSLYSGYFMQGIQEISFSKGWIFLLPVGIKKLESDPSQLAELLLRSLAFFDAFRTDKVLDISYFKPLDKFLDYYSELANNFSKIEADGRLELLESLIKKLNECEQIKNSLFRHTIGESTRSTFNIKYIDTLFVGLLNFLSIYPQTTSDKLLEMINEFKSDRNFISDYITSQGGGDVSYTANRVIEGIKYFDKFVN